MKNKDKVKKIHESKIGKIIYGFLMFMPLLAIGVTCLYTIFNKNAYQSYSGEVSATFEEQNVASFDDLIVGNKYRYTSKNVSTTTSSSKRILISDVEIISSNASSTFNNDLLNNATAFTTNAQKYIIIYNQDTAINSYDIANYNIIFNFICEGYSNATLIPYEDAFDGMITKIVYNKNFYVDNVFYYSIEQTENSNLFNWAKDSIIYTGMHDFTTQLNVSNNFMPMLLSYWLIVSIIYFLYDIALIMLNIVHRKIHELQDSL